MRATSVVALGCWASAGTIKALGAGLGWLPAIMLGVITAVGGGILRDFCIGEIPSVLGGNTLYATAALAASAVLVITPHHCTDPGNRGRHRRRCRSLPAGRMASLEAAARPLLRADQNRTGSSQLLPIRPPVDFASTWFTAHRSRPGTTAQAHPSQVKLLAPESARVGARIPSKLLMRLRFSSPARTGPGAAAVRSSVR